MKMKTVVRYRTVQKSAMRDSNTFQLVPGSHGALVNVNQSLYESALKKAATRKVDFSGRLAKGEKVVS